MPNVQIPGVGSVSFPDSMSSDDITAAIERDILPNQKPATGDSTNTALSGAASTESGSTGTVPPADQATRDQASLALLQSELDDHLHQASALDTEITRRQGGIRKNGGVPQNFAAPPLPAADSSAAAAVPAPQAPAQQSQQSAPLADTSDQVSRSVANGAADTGVAGQARKQSPFSTFVDSIQQGADKMGVGLFDFLSAQANKAKPTGTGNTDLAQHGLVPSGQRVASAAPELTGELGRFVLDRDPKTGAYVPPPNAEQIAAEAKSITPAVAKLSPTQAYNEGLLGKWALAQVGGAAAPLAAMIPAIVQPEIAPAVFSAMGASAAGSHYRELVEQGVDPHKAAATVIPNAIVNAGSNYAMMGASKLAAPMFLKVLNVLPDAEKTSIAREMMRYALAATATTASEATVNAGIGAGTQVASNAIDNASAGTNTPLTEGAGAAAAGGATIGALLPAFHALAGAPRVAADAVGTARATGAADAARTEALDKAATLTAGAKKAAPPEPAAATPADAGAVTPPTDLNVIRKAGEELRAHVQDPNAPLSPETLHVAQHVDDVIADPAMKAAFEGDQSTTAKDEGTGTPAAPESPVEPPVEGAGKAPEVSTPQTEAPNAPAAPESSQNPIRSEDIGVPSAIDPTYFTARKGDGELSIPQTPDEATIQRGLDERLARAGKPALTPGAIRIEEPTSAEAAFSAEFKKTFGTEIAWVTSAEKTGVDGFVSNRDGGNRTIYLMRPEGDFNRSTAMFLAGHELTHVMRQLHPDIYAELHEAMKGAASPEAKTEAAGVHGVADKDRGNGLGSKLDEEINADYGGRLLSDPKFVDNLRKSNPDLFGRIAAVVKDFLDKMWSVGQRTLPAGSKFAKDTAAARDAWTKALTEFAKREQGAEPAGKETVERRSDVARRKAVDEMSPEEMKTALRTDEMTGLGNRRAYDEAPKKAITVSIDGDSLKWVNDNMGHESGDHLLRVIGEALKGHDAYHVSGDEFLAQFDSRGEAAVAMKTVEQALKKAVITVKTPDGKTITIKGVGATHGIGKDKASADVELNKRKSERQQAGERAARGEPPPGLVRRPERAPVREAQEAPKGKQDRAGDRPVADAKPAAASAGKVEAPGAQAVSAEAKAGSARVKQMREIEGQQRLESQWQRLMQDQPVPELTKAEAKKHLERLNAAPGDNAKARMILEEKAGAPKATKQATVDKKAAFDKAFGRVGDMQLDADVKKSTVRSVANEAFAKGLLRPEDHAGVMQSLKDMDAEDAIDELHTSLLYNAEQAGIDASPERGNDDQEASARHDATIARRSAARRVIEAGRRAGQDVYARAEGNGEGVRVLGGRTAAAKGRYEVTPVVAEAYHSAGISTPALHELQPAEAAAFREAIEGSKAGNKYAASVYVYPEDEYRNMRLFMADGGKTGFALKGDDIVSVFNHDPDNPGAADAMLELAVAEGGKRLDAFDTILPYIYADHGMRVAARLPWDDSQSPAGWSKKTFDSFNHGEPDVVFMALDKDRYEAYQPGEGPYAKDYDDAVAMQTRAVKGEFSAAAPRDEEVSAAPTRSIGDSILKAFSPASRGDLAQQTAGIMRDNLAQQARDREVAFHDLEAHMKTFDKLSPKDSYDFIDAMEHGLGRGRLSVIGHPEWEAPAKALASLLDQRRATVAALGTGKLEQFIENYFPHIWADPAKAESFFRSRRPLEGSKSFLKQRTYEDFTEGLDAGLQPVTNNPVRLALLKAREMDRYIYGQRIFKEMKDNGLAQFVRFGKHAPDGWTKLDDRIAKVMFKAESGEGMIQAGEYFSPDEAATIFNNHLSPGFAGKPVFDLWRKSGNMLNAAQLGLSLFHLGFTTADAMISKTALGFYKLGHGSILSGASDLAQGAASPAQPFVNLYKGDRLLRAYLGKLQDPGLAPIVEAMTRGGGRISMDDFYRNAGVSEFRDALRTGRYGSAAMHFLPTVIDRVMAPVMQWLVPRQKLGVFFDLASHAINENPGMSLKEKRVMFGKMWDSVDNRMGQMVYDNLFWKRTLKDAAMASVRSVGWNLGTIRELGGGLLDVKDIPKGGLSTRTSYIAALTFNAALWGSIMQYLMTGQGPDEPKDMFFPKTGRTRPDGTEDRVSLPTYMKDVYEYSHDISGFVKYGANPAQTLLNKMHPLISMVTQMLKNEDFFGGAIRNPGDDWQDQLKDEMAYIVKQIQPFGIRNFQQQKATAGETDTSPLEDAAGYVTSPTFFGVTPSPGYITKTDEQTESSMVTRMRDSLVSKYRQQIKDGTDPTEVESSAQRAGLSPRDVRFILNAATPRPPKMHHFGIR